MKCRKAFDLDLADFVVDPGSEGCATFRVHYASCEDCAAEVAVWDEMQALLRSGGPGPAAAHPPKDLLLRYEEQPHTLSASETAAIRRHLAACRACPDELAALRKFDFSVVGRQPSPRPQTWQALVLDVVARIRPVVLHPAFAYALVVILLYPAFIQPRLAARGLPAERIALESPQEPTEASQRTTADGDEIVPPPPLAERIPEEPLDAAPAHREPRSPREDAAAEPAVASEVTQPTDGDSQLADANTRPRRTTPRRALEVGKAVVPPERGTRSAAAPTNHAADEAPATKEPSVADDEEDASDADAGEPRVLGLADTEEPRDDARHAERAAAKASIPSHGGGTDASWHAILLASDRTPEVQLADLVTGVALRVPSPDHALEVRVVGPGGREAARETFRSPSGDPVEVRIRTSQLVAGTYRVLTRNSDRSAASDQISELLFIVR